MISQRKILEYWQNYDIIKLFESRDATDQRIIDFFEKHTDAERFYVLHAWQVKHAVEHELIKRKIMMLNRILIFVAILLMTLSVLIFMP